MRLFSVLILLLIPFQAVAETVRFSDGRYYRIDLPDDVTAPRVIVGLHGGGGGPEQFARSTRLSDAALRLGYAVIYPAGSGAIKTWNVGYCCGAATRNNVDDLAFLDRVIDDAGARFGLNAERVYITGMSNGSMMAEYYAARRSQRVAAVVGVAGSFDATTRLRDAVPLLVIHGTADQNVPFNGGEGVNTRNGTDFSAVADVIIRFAAAFGRNVQEVEMRSGVVWRHNYMDAHNKPVVVLIRIDGGGHVWPGGRRTQREPSSINATQEALSFFALHP
ncbi:hypothetical protein DS901_07185 [Loktanella sp. D2R18]|uniref:alpha/beta hydrolase family esterase n=1 Tax=Rhodobacterales TaxID=204455 RepID=UPI000DE95B29|nr:MULTISPECIES: alpha/beta fold hydrolase [Rhodobacterales]MDO6589554.1 PHB depolymerase family esterase [Yoonia sp. 1_MG-2023]RBW44195.1 hypothetical protein DS901_07185 [Loktanella sp. D2R18]